MPEQNDLFYTDHGKGFPVILLHGFCETHELWNDFSIKLSEDFRVLCVDLPGFGKSNLLKDNFSISDVALKVIGLLKKLAVKECVCIGHSLGGYVTLAIAALETDLLKGFSLFHSTAYADNEEKKVSRNKVIDFVSKNGVAAFVETFIPPLFYDKSSPHIPFAVKMALQTRPETLIGYTKAMRDRPDLTGIIENFKKSILLIAGAHDGGIPPESMKKQAALNAHVSLHIVQDAAHMGMFEKEAETLSLIRQFLLETSGEF